MARLYSSGFENGHVQAEDMTATGSPTFDTTTFRSGARALRTNPSAAAHYVQRVVHADTAGKTWFVRCFINIATAPSATVAVLEIRDSSTAIMAIRMTNGLNLQLWDSANGLQLGSNSSALSTGTWYRVEITYAGGTGVSSARIDGTQFASGTGSVSGIGILRVGVTAATTADLYFDDLAVNDSVGTDQASWPGEGKIVYLRPSSDPGTSSANWKKPGGDTTNRHTSVDNIPPVYETYDSTSASAEDYLSNAVSGAGAALELDTNTYTSAGIGGSDTITLVRPMAGTGSSSATDTAGKLGAASNPAITVLSFTAFDNGVASSTATTWPRQEGTVAYNPSVTLGSACRLRVEKTTATTRVAIVNMLALLVEYVPAAGGTDYAQPVDDTLSLADSLSFDRGLVVADSVTTSDARTFDRGLGIADTLSLADSQVFDRGLVLVDTVSLADALAFGRELVLTDSVSLADAIAEETGKGVTINDSVTLADSLVFDRGLTLTEALSVVDNLFFQREMTLTDVLSVADSLSFDRGLTLADVVSITDDLSAALGAQAYTINVDDSVAVSDMMLPQMNVPPGVAAQAIARWFISRYGFYGGS